MASPHRLEVILNHLHGFSQISTKRTSSSKYRYTLDNNVLTDEQRAFYEENGYLIIRKLFDEQLLDEFTNRFLDICNEKIELGQMKTMREKVLMNTDAKGEHLINKVQDILFDDVFIKYIKNPLLLKYVECFTGPSITAIQSMVINKPPTNGNLSSINPLHQDLYYLPMRPAERIVASWTAMENVTVANGCLVVVPGSHTNPLQPHDYPKFDVNFMHYEVKGSDSLPRVHLEMNKGDTVFFHPLLFHGSGANMTKGFRKIIQCHYASSNCHFFENLDASQDLLRKDMKKVFELKGMNLSHLEMYQLRNMLIKGEPGILQQF